MLRTGWVLALVLAYPAVGMAALTYQDHPRADSDLVERTVFSGAQEVARLVLDGNGNVIRSTGTVPDGVAEYYDKDQRLRGRLTFQGGVLSGPAATYYPDGTLYLEANYTGNRLHGAYRLYDAQGRLKTDYRFQDGRLDGEQKVYYDSGQLMSRSRYSYGVKDGPLLMYHENGRVAYKSDYHQGHQLRRAEFDEDGREIGTRPGPSAGPPDTEEPAVETGAGAAVEPEALLTGTRAETPAGGGGHRASDRWQGRIVIFGSVPSAAFSMAQVNAYLNDWDEFLNYYGVRSSLGLAAQSTFTGGAGYWVSDAVFAGLEGEVLSCETSSGGDQLGVDFRARALELGGVVQVGTHVPPHVFMAGLGGYSVTLIDAWEYLHLNAVGYSDAFRVFHGSTLGLKFMAGYQVELAPFFGLGVDLGYRLAAINDVTFTADNYQEEPFIYAGDPVNLDFSGFYVRAGLRLYFQTR